MASPPEQPPISPADVPSVAAPFRLQYEQAQQAWVLLYPEGMVRLNGPAGEILRRCDGARPVSGIVAELEQAFEQSGLGEDVAAFLKIARERGWVAFAAGTSPHA